MMASFVLVHGAWDGSYVWTIVYDTFGHVLRLPEHRSGSLINLSYGSASTKWLKSRSPPSSMCRVYRNLRRFCLFLCW